MIPKGAWICFAIGVFGGGALGTYLYQTSSQIPVLIYQEGPSLTIIPDKINYKMNETVHVRVINSGTVPLEFPDASYGIKVRGLDGSMIYSPVSAQVISTLEPKEEKTLTWDQTRSDGKKVFEGRYKIELTAKADDTSTVKKSVTINIFQ